MCSSSEPPLAPRMEVLHVGVRPMPHPIGRAFNAALWMVRTEAETEHVVHPPIGNTREPLKIYFTETSSFSACAHFYQSSP